MGRCVWRLSGCRGSHSTARRGGNFVLCVAFTPHAPYCASRVLTPEHYKAIQFDIVNDAANDVMLE